MTRNASISALSEIDGGRGETAGGRSRLEYQLACRLAAGEIVLGLSRLGERIDPMDVDLQLPSCSQRNMSPARHTSSSRVARIVRQRRAGEEQRTFLIQQQAAEFRARDRWRCRK